MDLPAEIKRRLEFETRSPKELMKYLEGELFTLYFSRKTNTEQIIGVCTALIALHNQLAGEGDE